MFIFPVEGENPTRHCHFSLWAVIAVCIAVFIISPARHDEYRQVFFENWGFIPASSEFLNIFTSIFVHGGYQHLLGNMFFLWMFGDNIEDVVGFFLFLVCYFICGLVATLAYTYFHPDSLVPLIGASGAISGIVGMYLVFFPRVSAELVFFVLYWEFHRIKTTIFAAVGCWFLMQIVLGLVVEATSLGNYIRVAFSAHAGGFLAGILLGYVMCFFGYMDRYLHEGKAH